MKIKRERVGDQTVAANLKAVSTEQPLGSALNQEAQNTEIDRVFAAQQEHAITLRTSTYAERAARLQALLQAVEAHQAELFKAGMADFNKPEAEMMITEIMPVVSEIKLYLRKLKGWMKPQKQRATMAMNGTQAWIRPQPRGVCLIISPWNYPFNLTLGPLVAAIGAGNTAILKPSEMTPNISAVTTKLIRATFADNEVAIFEGEVETSQKLLSLPFDHIFFTGAPSVGKIVMAQAAKSLASVTLELGGKSPTIVDSSADLKKAASRIVWAKTTNCGQTCIAPDYLYVHESVREAFITELKKQITAVFGETNEAQLANPDYARIVNDRHFGRINTLLEDAKSKGATVLSGGHVDSQSRFIQPTLLGNVSSDMSIMQDEIFGPLLPIMSYTSIEPVIKQINAGEKPLALYIYAKDNELIEKITAETSSGSAVINHCVLQFAHKNLPFGGVNNSGIGSSHGIFGFKSFSHERAIMRDRFSVGHWMFPPYTPRVKRFIGLVVKHMS